MGNSRKNVLLVVVHDKDLYQENDAFLHHHDVVQLLDFQKTLNPVLFVPVIYKTNKIQNLNQI
jgi:predicted glycosyltransferase involved in capsule biosynthesis